MSDTITVVKSMSIKDKLLRNLNSLRAHDNASIFLVLIIMVGALSIFTPNFFSSMNLINIIRQIAFIAIIGFGVTGVIVTGGIDLSSGSIVGLTSVIVASVAHPGQMPLVFSLAIGMAVGIVCGFANGFILAKTKIPPFIVTLGMFTAARGAALLFTNGRPVNDLSKGFVYLGAGKIGMVPVPIIIMLLAAVLVHVLFVHMRFGKHIFALGGNMQAAIISGVNVSRAIMLIYTLAGALASLAGITLTARISSGQPNLGIGFELDAIAAAVIGGTSMTGGVGTIPGTIAGALIIGVINNGMSLLNINAYWQQIVKGFIIVLAVFIDQMRNRVPARSR